MNIRFWRKADQQPHQPEITLDSRYSNVAAEVLAQSVAIEFRPITHEDWARAQKKQGGDHE